MADAHWHVWGIDTERRRAVPVQAGTRAQCEGSARLRNQSPAGLRLRTLRYEALPAGRKPELPEEPGK